MDQELLQKSEKIPDEFLCPKFDEKFSLQPLTKNFWEIQILGNRKINVYDYNMAIKIHDFPRI